MPLRPFTHATRSFSPAAIFFIYHFMRKSSLSLSFSLLFSFFRFADGKIKLDENEGKAGRNGGGGRQMSENEPQRGRRRREGASHGNVVFLSGRIINRTDALSSSTRGRTVGVVQFRIKSNCSHAARLSPHHPLPPPVFPPRVPSRRYTPLFRSNRSEFGSNGRCVKFVTI